jgi:hypothetical protein
VVAADCINADQIGDLEVLVDKRAYWDARTTRRGEFEGECQRIQKQLMQCSSDIEDSVLEMEHISWKVVRTVLGKGRTKSDDLSDNLEKESKGRHVIISLTGNRPLPR